MPALLDDGGYADLPISIRRFVQAAERLYARPGLPAVTWLRKGSWLFHDNSPVTAVYTVLDGSVVRRKPNLGGEPLAVDMVSRGGILGFRAHLGGTGCHRLSAQCVADTLVCRIAIEDLEGVLGADRTLEHDLLAAVAQDLNSAQERALQVATLGVRDRLLIVLAQFGRDFTTMNDERTMVLAPPVSRTDMAALAGMTPETLSRCIRTLEAEGLAHFSRHHVVISSVTQFRAALAEIGVAGDGAAILPLAC